MEMQHLLIKPTLLFWGSSWSKYKISLYGLISLSFELSDTKSHAKSSLVSETSGLFSDKLKTLLKYSHIARIFFIEMQYKYFCENLAHVFNLIISIKGCVSFFYFLLNVVYLQKGKNWFLWVCRNQIL